MSPSTIAVLKLSIVIPAYNEGATIGRTLRALQASAIGNLYELIVVDDGSTDDTIALARQNGATVIPLPSNAGKGKALETGLGKACGDLILTLDADLGETAGEALALVDAVASGRADMAIAGLVRPAGVPPGGFGIASRLAITGVQGLTSFRPLFPLSGQRAMTNGVRNAVLPLARGWGAEVGMTVDALRAGFHLVEVPTPITHRYTGRSWEGFVHRGRQCRDVALALWERGWPQSTLDLHLRSRRWLS